MPIAGSTASKSPDAPYFSSLEQLDAWFDQPSRHLDNVLPYRPLNRPSTNATTGRLLVCHDYKGGYTESPLSLSYTFNFWSTCDIFVYFSHHRVTIPPPGWISAAHRQGVKMLGTLIFEPGGEPDCLRLLVGRLPQANTGPASQPATSALRSVPLSPHYAKILADLAVQRGFDGYLLNFECALQGGMEQTRVLAAWIVLLRAELLKKVGAHAEVNWYDSVIVDGRLRWQDRLNSLNLPFFLSSTSFFTNYTWHPSYPNTTAQYFLTLDLEHGKSLQDIYTGVDVWGRGCYGGGGLGSYKAIAQIDPQSLGLSVALFGQAWSWETEQDRAGFSWHYWWNHERTLWSGALPGQEVVVPIPDKDKDAQKNVGTDGPFVALQTFFSKNAPPDPADLPFHTTFCPGVGESWFVNGLCVFSSKQSAQDKPFGWTDVDKQTTVGDMLWPFPAASWHSTRTEAIRSTSEIYMKDAWNGGSCVKITLDSELKHTVSTPQRIDVPIQTMSLTPGRSYTVSVTYKAPLNSVARPFIKGTADYVVVSRNGDSPPVPQLRGWESTSVDFTISPKDISSPRVIVHLEIGLSSAQFCDYSILIGQMNVHLTPLSDAILPSSEPMILWADYKSPKPIVDTCGRVSWEIASSLPLPPPLKLASPDDPVLAFPVQTAHPLTHSWHPELLYCNVYVQPLSVQGVFDGPEATNVKWLGTSGCEGRRNEFLVNMETVKELLGPAGAKGSAVRFYIQGVTDCGEVIPWHRCVYVTASV